MTHTMAFLSLPVFVAAKEHSKSKAVQLEGFPLASTPPKLFLRQPVHNGTFSHFYTLWGMQPSTLPENVSSGTCGG